MSKTSNSLDVLKNPFLWVGVVGVLLMLWLVSGSSEPSELRQSMVRHDHQHGPGDGHEHSASIEEMERELRSKPDDLVLRGAVAHSLMEGAPEKAIHHYREILKRDPKDGYARLHLAESLVVQGKLREAYGYAQVLLEEERSPETLALMARIHYDLGNFEEALELSRDLLAVDPGNEQGEKLKEYSLLQIADGD